MATLNELGRNSASVTYGPYATGQDLFPTLQAVDTWFRNDTWQGIATASGTTVTGLNNTTIWSTQARAGDYIIIAGQQRIISSVVSDSSLTVTVAFSPAISTASTVRVISNTQPTQTAGYVSTIVRGSTFGTVSVTANSTTITGTGTYFLSEATNLISTVSMTGTVSIDTSGNITGSSTQFTSGAPTNNSIYPGDSVAVTLNGAIYYFTIATVTDNTTATVATAPTIAISGATIAKATNGGAGRSININGRMRTITAIASNTSMTVNFAMDFTDTNLKYKVYPRGTISNSAAAGGTLYGTTSATSSNSTTLTIAATLTGVIQPGSYIYGPLGIIPTGTFIVNQQFGASGASIANTVSTGTSGQNTIVVSSNTNIAVGQLVCGNGTSIAGIPLGTYVVSISGTTITLSQNLTGAISTTVYFYAPGGLGAYTTNNATTTTGTQIYFSTLQITNGNAFWDLGYNFANSTTNAVFQYQTSQLDQVWIGDEVRTLNFSTYSGALMTNAGAYCYSTDYVGFSGNAIGALRQSVYLLPFRREDSYINGNIYGTTTAFLSDLRIGDDLIIDGTECTVTNIISNTQFKINMDFTHTTANNSGGSATASTTQSSGGTAGATTFVVSSATNIAAGQLITGTGLSQGTYVTNVSSTTVTVSNAFLVNATGTYNFYNGTNLYKKLKLHGYTLEGTREGGAGLPPSNPSATGYSVTATVTSTTTANFAVTSPSGVILPGMQILPTSLGGTVVTGLTYIVNQQFATGPSVNYTSCAGSNGSNILTTGGTPTSTVTVGMIVTGNGAAIAGIPAGTYVTNITGTSPTFTLTLSQNLTAAVSGQVYFNAAGGAGTYTTNIAATFSAAAVTLYTPLNNKFSQACSITTTGGTVYPIGTSTIVTSIAPAVGQYNFVKISGAGGPATPLTGQVTTASTYVYGTNTLFTTQLHIGAEIVVGGQYLTVVSITSDTLLNVRENAGAFPIPYLTPIYRSVPLYTYALTTSTTTINLATPIKNTLYTNVNNPPQVYFPLTGADFIEYVYSAPNYSAEQGSTTLLNTSLDRKYVGFRLWPLYQSLNTVTTTTNAIASAFGAYATPVYERWTAGYAQTHGVGINQADLSGGTMVWGNIPTATTLAVRNPVCGSVTLQMSTQGLVSGYPNPVTAVTAVTMGGPNATYTISSSPTQATDCPIVFSLYGIYDITAMSQVAGGTIFLFGNKRYFAIQGRSSGNVQTQWLGCIEFERAQPEDASTGTGTTTGVTFGGLTYTGIQLAQGSSTPAVTTPSFAQTIQYISGTAPYPTYGYFNGNRMPVGSQQIPTVPQVGTVSYPVHGCVLACPRVRNSAGDLVGYNANIYSAMTITTGRWGHLVEFGNNGGIVSVYTSAVASVTATSNTLTNIANVVPQPHMGQIVPVYTNIYNSKRFMFSPVVVLGPAYDPDVRGRLYGLKVLPSALGTLMDTVSVTVDANYFYNTSFSATDHWVITTPPNNSPGTINTPGTQGVVTARFTTTANTPQIQQSWRSLEDVNQQVSSTGGQFLNNFRFGLPA